jgi:PIN domain nuclease of toxin-antitoxin system
VILLDTCAILWSSSGALSQGGRRAARSAANRGELFVSPISFWEIATLARRSRVVLDLPLEDYLERVEASEVRVAALTPQIARAAGSFDERFPGDPADRILVATALAMNLKLMTRDRALLALDRGAGLRVVSC